MMLTVVAIVCNVAVAAEPVCRPEIVSQGDAAIGLGCLMAEGQLDDWKAHSIFRGDRWIVRRVMCIAGEYHPKEAT